MPINKKPDGMSLGHQGLIRVILQSQIAINPGLNTTGGAVDFRIAGDDVRLLIV